MKAQIRELTEAVKKAEAQGDETITVRVESMRQDISLRRVVAYGSIGLFGLMNLGAIVLFYLNGFAMTALSDTALLGLLGATIAEVAGVMYIVARYLFPQSPPVVIQAPTAGTNCQTREVAVNGVRMVAFRRPLRFGGRSASHSVAPSAV